MEIAIYNIEGKDTGRKVSLDDAVFGVEPNEHAIYLDVKQYMANRRQGTHKTKERWENAHSTRKIKRQKGTGGARAGSLKSPVFVGGGTIFGPQPRDYSFKLNKKTKQLARLSALSYKAKTDGIVVVEDFKFETPKTKEFVQVQKNLKVDGKKSLFVLQENNDNIYLSARNLQKTKVVTLSGLNTYSIVDASVLVFCESSIRGLQQNTNTDQPN
ncbi:MAG: 50S ribosomal protein L4 [Bacteroidales bacterium]|jgi:large subunit ribosomal protein L4|nr:50S ribosomal protein L4 [Bacteroidales bacterium]